MNNGSAGAIKKIRLTITREQHDIVKFIIRNQAVQEVKNASCYEGICGAIATLETLKEIYNTVEFKLGVGDG